MDTCILDPEYSIIIKNTIDFYGKENQLNVCMEEPAELILVITKHDFGNVIEELADTYICISILQAIYDIPNEQIYGGPISTEKVDVAILVNLIKAISKMRRYNEQPKEDLIYAMTDTYALINWYLRHLLPKDKYIYTHFFEIVDKKMCRTQRRMDEAIANNLKYTDINKEESK